MEAPKIEITDINPSADPEFYEADSGQWPELFQGSGDFLVEQSFRQLQDQVLDSHGGVCNAQRRSSSRRTERGPGKSPSPSRNSPRRHSPVPYSPKRQHRACSPVTLDDYYDVTLSPRRRSPVPRLVDGIRAQSLTSDEFTCVSYSDPFSPFPAFDSSEGDLGISMEDSSQKDPGELVEGDNKDLNSTEMLADISVKTSWLDATCLSPDDRCLEDALALLEESDDQGAPGMADQEGQDGDLFLYEFDEGKLSRKSRRRLTHTDSGHFLAANCPDPASLYDTEVTSQTFCAGSWAASNGADSSDGQVKNSAQVVQVPVVEKHENPLDVDTDSSSEDDEMEEEETITFQSGGAGCVRESQARDMTGSSAQPWPGPTISTFRFPCDSTVRSQEPCTVVEDSSRSVCKGEAASVSVQSETAKVASDSDELGKAGNFIEDSGIMEELTLDDPSWSSVADDKSVVMFNEAASSSTTCPPMESELFLDAADEESKESTDSSILQHFCDEYANSPGAFSADAANFSLYTPNPDDSSSSVSDGAVLETSSGKTPHSKTPEDFALPRLVGSPPLHFPHCHNVVLIHHALSNPYNPHLPTPPIVLTFPDSYQDLEVASPAPEAERAFEELAAFKPVPMAFSCSSQKRSKEEGDLRDDISKSASCPNLNHADHGQFQRPHQAWPIWGHPRYFEHNETNACTQEGGGKFGFRDDCQYAGGQPAPCSPHNSMEPVTCFSVPSSPRGSRAVVIDRLRKVVERRLSGSLESLEG